MSASRFHPVRLDAPHPIAAPDPTVRPARRETASPRMRVLLVVGSRSVAREFAQGLAELTTRLTDRVAWTISGDPGDPSGLDLLTSFAASHAVPLAVAPAVALRSLLRRDDWDLIETVGQIDPATLEVILDEVADRALVHTAGPLTTLAENQNRLIQRADAVLCESAHDRQEIQRTLAPGRNHCFQIAPDPAEPAIEPPDWEAIAAAKWQILAASWFTRHYLDRPFQGPRPLVVSTKSGHPPIRKADPAPVAGDGGRDR